MKFTIIIPNYNHGRTLARALQSAVDQSADEVILVDDCSTDNSLEVAESFDITIVRHQKKNENFLYGMESILRQLKTDYLVSLGADDILYPNIVSTMKDNLQICPNKPGLIFCDYDLLQEGDPPKTIESRKFKFKEPTYLSPAEAKEHMIKSGPSRLECGVGSAIRIDELNWLMDQHIFDLGPWTDSWGYITVAIKSGCLYIPGSFAGFTVVSDKPSYHQRVLGNSHEMERFRKVGENWLKQPEISSVIDSVPFTM